MCNFIGASIRLSSSLPDTPIEYRSMILHIGKSYILYNLTILNCLGNLISACAPPFFLVLAPKVAEKWFAAGERATAHVFIFIGTALSIHIDIILVFSASPLGVALGTLIPTMIIDQSKVTVSSFDFFTLVSALFSIVINDNFRMHLFSLLLQ